MRVEFVGLPGAGKTHRCREAQSALRSHGIEARLDCVEQWRYQRGRAALDALATAVGRQRGVGVAAGAFWLRRHAREASGVPNGSVGGALAYLVAVDSHVRRLDPGLVWLHDQASVQALWSLSMRAGVDVDEVVDRFGARIAWPDVVVEARAPLETVLERLARREALPSSLRGAEGAAQASALERGSVALASLRERGRSRSTWLALPERADAIDEVVRLVSSIMGRD